MGGADCICSDKTGKMLFFINTYLHFIFSFNTIGTLTKNEMTLTDWWNEELVSFEREKKFDLEKDQNMSASFCTMFKEQVALNSAAMLRPSEKGSKTEIAALKLIE